MEVLSDQCFLNGPQNIRHLFIMGITTSKMQFPYPQRKQRGMRHGKLHFTVLVWSSNFSFKLLKASKQYRKHVLLFFSPLYAIFDSLQLSQRRSPSQHLRIVSWRPCCCAWCGPKWLSWRSIGAYLHPYVLCVNVMRVGGQLGSSCLGFYWMKWVFSDGIATR